MGVQKYPKHKKKTPIKCHLENFRESHHVDEHDLLYKKINPMVCPKR
jgi:hypothetical protein